MPDCSEIGPLSPPLGLIDAAHQIRDGSLRSVDLLASSLARIDRDRGRFNALLWQDRAGAWAAAAAADADRAAGRSLGPLHGVPLAHKDLFAQQGQPQTAGSDFWRYHRAQATATVLARLSAAGSYAYAGLHMAEFAQNPTGHNATFGDCINPWDPTAITGGSSSGSAVAVALGYTAAALGTDTGGSIRLPAACCGVTGIKPTYGRVSRFGVVPLCASLDAVGPLARTAAECALMLQLIAGADAADQTCSTLPVPAYSDLLDGDLRGQRIGVPPDGVLDAAAADVRSACRTALTVLRDRGATLVPIVVPLLDAIATYGGTVARVEAAALHAQWMREAPKRYVAHVSGRLYPGYAIPATYYAEALGRRAAVLAAFVAAAFGEVDVLATPVLTGRVPSRAETDMDIGPPGTERRFFAVGDNVRPFNYLGLPAISFPCGMDAAGLPIGLQLVGRPFAEARLLRLADAYQRDAGPPPLPPDT